MSDAVRFTELLGKRIRAIRKEMGLKRADFARLAGMSEDAIGLIERGDSSPRIDSLYKISVNLKIPLSKLLDFNDDITAKGANPDQRSLSALNLYLRNKSSDQIQMIHDVAHDIFSRCGGERLRRHGPASAGAPDASLPHCVHKPDKSWSSDSAYKNPARPDVHRDQR